MDSEQASEDPKGISGVSIGALYKGDNIYIGIVVNTNEDRTHTIGVPPGMARCLAAQLTSYAGYVETYISGRKNAKEVAGHKDVPPYKVTERGEEYGWYVLGPGSSFKSYDSKAVAEEAAQALSEAWLAGRNHA